MKQAQHGLREAQGKAEQAIASKEQDASVRQQAEEADPTVQSPELHVTAHLLCTCRKFEGVMGLLGLAGGRRDGADDCYPGAIACQAGLQGTQEQSCMYPPYSGNIWIFNLLCWPAGTQEHSSAYVPYTGHVWDI